MAHTLSKAKTTALFGDSGSTAPAGQGVSLSETSRSFCFRTAWSDGGRALFDYVWARLKREWRFCAGCKERFYI
jgi:hypothetical protein